VHNPLFFKGLLEVDIFSESTGTKFHTIEESLWCMLHCMLHHSNGGLHTKRKLWDGNNVNN